VFYAPTRGLIGYQSELLTDTRGTAIMNRLFHDYQPYKGEIGGRRNGVLISNAPGRSGGLRHVQPGRSRPDDDRARRKVYMGMIIGEPFPRERPRGQRSQGQAAHQHPRRRQGRSRR
jgi:GTP-binding protein